MAGLVVGAVGVCLQFAISIPASLAAGRSLGGSLVWFFSYFTILTNVAALLVLSASITGRPAFFSRALAKTTVAVAISVVSIVYAAVLAHLWKPEGLFWLADILLHYISPAIYVLWWLTEGRSGTARAGDIPRVLAYPLAYLCWVLARGAAAGEYPYPFLDLTVRSMADVATAAVLVLALFVAVSLAVVAADRFLPRKTSR